MEEYLKKFQPAWHRQLIREGKMTEGESERLIKDWLYYQMFRKQMMHFEKDFSYHFENDKK